MGSVALRFALCLRAEFACATALVLLARVTNGLHSTLKKVKTLDLKSYVISLISVRFSCMLYDSTGGFAVPCKCRWWGGRWGRLA